MKKNKTVGVAKILCAVLVLGTTGITAYAGNTALSVTAAASTTTQLPEDTSVSNNLSAAVDSQETDGDDVEDTAKQAELAAQAKITEAEAISAAQTANPGYTFTMKELENENGTICYKLKGTDTNGAKIKCYVNAMDGSVDTRASEQENDSEDAAKQAELAAQVKITEAEAISAAQTAVPGWTFGKSELDSENGTVIYELKGTDASGNKQTIHVNAMDGSIVQETGEND